MPRAQILGSRFGRLGQALFNLNQPLTLDTAESTVVGSYSVDNPPTDMKPFAGIYCCMGGFLTGAVGAQFSRTVLQLGPTAGRLVVLKRITLQSTAALTFQMGFRGNVASFGAAPAAGNIPQVTDLRMAQSGGAVATMQQDTNAALLLTNTFLYSTRTVAGTPTVVEFNGVVLAPLPGLFTGWIVEATTVATAFTISYEWEERKLEPQEATAP